jgi:hypothetical protein
VDKWDTANNIYVISTKRRIYGYVKPMLDLIIDYTGIVMSMRSLVIIEI